MKRQSLFAKIAAVTSMFTTMAFLVAFKAGAFDQFIADNYGDIGPDSSKKDTMMLKDYIVLSDSAFVIPAYVYSSKAMVMDYKLEFDTVIFDTISYDTPRGDSILNAKLKKDFRLHNGGRKDTNYMKSSKSGPVIDPSIYKQKESPAKGHPLKNQ
jgi:hypothetical protein